VDNRLEEQLEATPQIRINRVVSGLDGPFETTDVARDAAQVPRYTGLAASVVEALGDVVARSPHAEAVVETGAERLTYQQLWDRGAAVAGGLRDIGVLPGDRVAIALPNGTDWIVALLGVLMAGAVVVPVNTRLAPGERTHVLADASCRLTIDLENPAPTGQPYVHEDQAPAQLAAIFYTSGTTGRSKGATSSNEALLAVTENVRRALGLPKDLGADLRSLICVPLFHVTGFAAQLLPTLLSGGAVVILNGLDAGQMLATIAEERISFLVAVPAIYYYLLSSPDFDPDAVAEVRWAAYGGAPIAPDLVAKLKQALPATQIANGFGMSETSALATLLPHADSEQYADSVGYPCPCIDVGVADADPDSGVGEIVLRGQTVTAGYWGDPADSRGAFQDGWLRTGDIGRLDEAGRLYLVDRAKDMINRGGENVYSVEVENALAGAPGVNEVAVVAVPDQMMGEKVGCIIVSDGPVDTDAVLAHAAERIADYKVPQYVQVRSEPLPRNAAGKVLKHTLRTETQW
jgi:acyl-CoA synthetase (AMP-forming)/AMP-acid ligase II